MMNLQNTISNILLRIVSVFGTVASACTGLYWYIIKSITGSNKSPSAGLTIKQGILAAGLKIPPGMLKCTDEELDEICNGCGAKDSWITEFIPNNLGEINLRPCCNKHDYFYFVGSTREDYLKANRTLLNDLIQVCDQYIIDEGIPCSEAPGLHDKVRVYFDFVDRYGHRYFSNTKNTRLSADQIKKIIEYTKELNKG